MTVTTYFLDELFFPCIATMVFITRPYIFYADSLLWPLGPMCSCGTGILNVYGDGAR